MPGVVTARDLLRPEWFFYVPQRQIVGSYREIGPMAFCRYLRRPVSLTICRCQSKGSTFSLVILDPECWSWLICINKVDFHSNIFSQNSFSDLPTIHQSVACSSGGRGVHQSVTYFTSKGEGERMVE